jgi:hypothetical protein
MKRTYLQWEWMEQIITIGNPPALLEVFDS